MPPGDDPTATRPRTGALAALAAVASAGVLAAYWLWVRTRAGQLLDQDALDGRGISHRARDAAGALLSTISIGSLALAIAVLAGLALVRHRRTLAIVATVAIGGAVLTAEVLKLLILDRPTLIAGARPFHNSYPSGHTTIAYVVGLAAIIVAPRALRRLVAAAAFAYGTGIGLATVLAGWHRPSDVVGGLLVATAWTAGTVAAFTLTNRDAFGHDRRGLQQSDAEAGAARRYVLLGALVTGAGWIAAIAIVLGVGAGRLDLSHADAAFVAACAAIAGFAAIVFAALLSALRPVLRRAPGPAR